MYHKGWPLEKCIDSFLELARSSFREERVLGIPLVSWLAKMFRLYVHDGLYKPEHIESMLKTVLGAETTMLDHSYATQLGAKICVLVATVMKRPSCRIFTNYARARLKNRNHNHGECIYIDGLASADCVLRNEERGRRHREKCPSVGDVRPPHSNHSILPAVLTTVVREPHLLPRCECCERRYDSRTYTALDSFQASKLPMWVRSKMLVS